MQNEILVTIAGAVAVIIAAIIKTQRNKTGTTQSIIDKANIMSDIKHNKKDIEDIKTDIHDLYDEITKQHVESDKIMGLISNIKERIARLEGAQ